MKKILPLLLLLFSIQHSYAEKFQVDTLYNQGSPNKYINFVVMGDGFTASQQNFFSSKANELMKSVLTDTPYSNYINFFNAYAIRVISKESGVIHPANGNDCPSDMAASNPNTYFKSTFDIYGIHRLLYVGDAYSSLVYRTALDNLPQYSQIFVLCNTTEYGGGGGNFAVSSIHPSAHHIIRHELGHSFAGLADEYWAGDFYATEKVNMTQQTNPSLVKWKNWMNVDNVGIYQHAGTSVAKTWYKPHLGCKMGSLGRDFCRVCQQAVVKEILRRANFIVDYAPVNLSLSMADLAANNMTFELKKLMKPQPNTLKISWTLDGIEIASANDQEFYQLTENMLTKSTHTLTASVTDMTDMLRLEDSESRVVRSVTWQIERGTTGINLDSYEQLSNFQVYPTRTNDILNISVDSDIHSSLNIRIVDMNGKTVFTMPGTSVNQNGYKTQINVSNLTSGTYVIIFEAGKTIHSQRFVKY